jgi:hypothetical protein
VEFENAKDLSSAFRVEKRNQWSEVNLTLTYEHVRSRFDARLQRATQLQAPPLLMQAAMRRNQHSFFGVLKNRLDFERPQARYFDWDLSFRVDWIETRRNTLRMNFPGDINAITRRKPHLTYKIGLNVIGQIHGAQYNAYVLNGANIKLPTLLQLFYIDLQPQIVSGNIPQLAVEQNIGTEAGIRLEKDLPRLLTFLRMKRLEVDFAVFRNSYLEKIVEALQKETAPRPFNTKLARTTGFESRLALSLLNGLVDWNNAFLLLNISDPRVFRFKPEKKVTSDLWLRKGRNEINCHFFYEGEQSALILSDNRGSSEVLPERWDVDLSIQRTIRIKRLTGFLNFAVRNLRNSGRSELSGFFLQDRRWYASIGAQL